MLAACTAPARPHDAATEPLDDAAMMPEASPPDDALASEAAVDDAVSEAVEPDDGTPMRLSCTNSLGRGLGATYGRLDGYLVAVVSPGGRQCNSDSNHVHLQVLSLGSVYDVAVDVFSDREGGDPQVAYLARDGITAGAWSEGWHPGGGFDYLAAGLHSADFVEGNAAAVSRWLEGELATVNHVSVFGNGYGPDGMHLVHRNGANFDGAVLTHVLRAQPRGLFFRFANQLF